MDRVKSYIDLLEAYITDDEDSEAYKAFCTLADAQRGRPENAMLVAQRALQNLKQPDGDYYPSANAFGWILEHVGDITHRMSEYGKKLGFQKGNVLAKVQRGLMVLENPIDRARIEQIPHIPELKKYAEEHRKLKVYNLAQYHAKEAAVNLGEMNFPRAERHLMALEKMIEDGSYDTIAGEYDPDFHP